MRLKIALPKGRLLSDTAALLEGVGITDYRQGSRSYRLRSTRFPDLSASVFQEKDIPIQVVVGNYDLGICGLDWIEELLARYPTSALVKVADLGYGRGDLYLAGSSSLGISSVEELEAKQEVLRIISEYPNIAEALALKLRLRRFKVFPIWGAAEAYPPECAELAIIPGMSLDNLHIYPLVPLVTILPMGAFLVANRDSWERKDMGQVLDLLCAHGVVLGGSGRVDLRPVKGRSEISQHSPPQEPGKVLVRLALPDGHQQLPTVEFLRRAGVEVQGYSEVLQTRRPSSNIPGVGIRVIRPQDMPLQVANGNFDLAITGRDWLLDHLYRFPSSPVSELLELGFGKVKLVAAVSEDMPFGNVLELKQLITKGQFQPLRVVSEYVNIADKYARDNHLGWYKVLPSWGASETFLPEDADLLIENSQTGQTLARHKLRVIDTLFESTACLIGRGGDCDNPVKKDRIDSIINAFQRAVL